MKKKMIISSLCALLLTANSLVVSADYTETQTSFEQQNTTQQNYSDFSAEQSIDNSKQNSPEQNNNNVTANDLTTDNYLDYNTVGEDTNNSNNNFGGFGDNSNSEELNANIDYQDFSKNMNSFLNSAGFDYNDFTSKKFDIPDMSSIGTAADLREEYSNMLADFSQFGFGQKATLPDNSGYSMNVIASFNDSFGKGLITDFSGYDFTFDPSEVFNNANSTRNTLFQNAYNSSDYQIVANNLNVTNTMSKINAYSIDPSSINTNEVSINTLQSKISGYYENDKNKNYGTYRSEKGNDNSNFLSLQYSYIGENNPNSIKTQIENEYEDRFTRTYAYQQTVEGPNGIQYGTGQYDVNKIDLGQLSAEDMADAVKMGNIFYDAQAPADVNNNNNPRKIIQDKVDNHTFYNPNTGRDQTAMDMIQTQMHLNEYAEAITRSNNTEYDDPDLGEEVKEQAGKVFSSMGKGVINPIWGALSLGEAIFG